MADNLPKVVKWKGGPITLLIEAYEGERSLYAPNCPQYHDKHLRRESLTRIARVVKELRPTTDEEDCMNKLDELRNQFYIEHEKVRASMKNGTGTDNVSFIYQPTLWYYSKLQFLENYIKPRKSRYSLEQMSGDILQSTKSTTFEGNTQATLIVPTDIEIEPLTITTDSEQEMPINPPESSLPSSASDTARRSTKNSMVQPVTVNTQQKVEHNSPDTVDSFATFIGSLLRSFQDEKLKLGTMNNITQLVIHAKSADLQHAENRQ